MVAKVAPFLKLDIDKVGVGVNSGESLVLFDLRVPLIEFKVALNYF